MNQTKLKTGILGLNEAGQLFLKAASETDYFELKAVADKDTNLAEGLAEQYKCAAYDDYRQFVIQNQFDCLLVAAGIHSCDEYIRAGMKKKFNILKLAPPARGFEETAELVQLAEQQDIKFAIANSGRFAQSALALRDFLQQGKFEKIFLVTAFCAVDNKDIEPWRSDLKLAGGGVLLYECYDIIDQIIYNFGTPQQVYSLNTNQAGDKQQRLYLAEDTAVMTMKFSDVFSCNIIAGRAIGPSREFLKVYGKDKILTAGKIEFEVSDGAGKVIEQFRYEDDRFSRYKALLENFALSIILPDENKLCSSGKDNLGCMAAIESAYLSARTGFPEEPGRILEMTQLGPANA